MREVLDPELFDRWYQIYTSAGPGCISSFGHDAHSADQGQDVELAFQMRAESDIQDYELSGPINDLKLLVRVGQTALSASSHLTN